MRELQTRVAVITGAAGGLGRALALELAGRGMRLALADVDEAGMRAVADAIRERGGSALSLRTDVTDLRQVEKLLSATLNEWSACHAIINNAGVFHAAALLDTPYEQWRRVVDINLWGVIHGCHVFGPHFAARGEGHIVNIASAAGLFPAPGLSCYSTTKTAVVALSRQLRWELAPQGVGVTVVCPGVLRTNMARAEGSGAGHIDDLDRIIGRAPRTEPLARKVAQAIRRDRWIVRYGAEAQLSRLLAWVPDWLVEPFGRLVARRALAMVQRPDEQGPSEAS